MTDYKQMMCDYIDNGWRKMGLDFASYILLRGVK